MKNIFKKGSNYIIYRIQSALLPEAGEHTVAVPIEIPSSTRCF
jgi:hypothetical protein